MYTEGLRTLPRSLVQEWGLLPKLVRDLLKIELHSGTPM
jgi:hypothetical protein